MSNGSANKYADDAMAFVKDRTEKFDKDSKTLVLQVENSIARMEEKVRKMDETDILMIKVREEVKSEVNSNVTSMILRAKDDIKDYIDQMFTIQGAIGPKEKYKSITDFIRQTKANVEQLHTDIDSKTDKIKASIVEMKEQSETENDRRDKQNKKKIDQASKDINHGVQK